MFVLDPVGVLSEKCERGYERSFSDQQARCWMVGVCVRMFPCLSRCVLT